MEPSHLQRPLLCHAPDVNVDFVFGLCISHSVLMGASINHVCDLHQVENLFHLLHGLRHSPFIVSSYESWGTQAIDQIHLQLKCRRRRQLQESTHKDGREQ